VYDGKETDNMDEGVSADVDQRSSVKVESTGRSIHSEEWHFAFRTDAVNDFTRSLDCESMSESPCPVQ